MQKAFTLISEKYAFLFWNLSDLLLNYLDLDEFFAASIDRSNYYSALGPPSSGASEKIESLKSNFLAPLYSLAIKIKC